ncbi:MAG: DNA alkylation repair protein [Actinomycetia bacterium]|nr:DNA alkylation repair protein [Actinomycetes bacterium]
MDVFDTLRAAANPEQAKRMSAYMRNHFAFLGIETPKRRKLCREFLKSQKSVDWGFVFECWQQPEREYQYLAVDCLAKLKGQLTAADIPNLERLTTSKSWWDTVDALDMVVGDIALRHEEVNATLLQWSSDENIWLRRCAIDHQRGRKNKTNTVLLEQILLNNFGQSEFFINKAIGWSLRDFSKTDPDWVRQFIDKHKENMSPLSVREGSKYL